VTRAPLIEEELTRSVVGAFFDTYNVLGYGFLEHVYERALDKELRERGHAVAREVAVPIFYKDSILSEQRLDMIVDKKLVVEIKSTQELHKSAARQVYNYLRATNLEVGLLLHFGPRAQFHRFVHPIQKKRMAHMGQTNPLNPKNPLHPDQTSVSVARRAVANDGAFTPGAAADPHAVTKVDTAGGPEPRFSDSSCLKNT
jgi:GxxExxY protein